MLYLLIISVVLNGVLGYFLVRVTRKLLQFDVLFDIIADDLDVGIKFFSEVMTRPMFSNSPELSVISRNINVLRDRLMVNAQNINLLKPKHQELPKNYQKPVVVD